MSRKNPNPESRIPKEIRKSNSESLRQFSAGIQPKIDPGFRTSSRIAGFRISAIGFRHFSIA
jgi:hypothetical protein